MRFDCKQLARRVMLRQRRRMCDIEKSKGKSLNEDDLTVRDGQKCRFPISGQEMRSFMKQCSSLRVSDRISFEGEPDCQRVSAWLLIVSEIMDIHRHGDEAMDVAATIAAFIISRQNHAVQHPYWILPGRRVGFLADFGRLFQFSF
jgi:hypothetical protein